MLAIAILALYAYRLAGPWRWIYVVGAVVSLYLECLRRRRTGIPEDPFVNALAPTQSEPPFPIAQGIVLLIFIALGVLAVRWFHPPIKSSALEHGLSLGGRVSIAHSEVVPRIADASTESPARLAFRSRAATWSWPVPGRSARCI